jgi:hypothetical protein
MDRVAGPRHRPEGHDAEPSDGIGSLFALADEDRRASRQTGELLGPVQRQARRLALVEPLAFVRSQADDFEPSE